MMRSSHSIAKHSSYSSLRKNQRALFALFIKILLKTLEEAEEDMLRQQVRTVIATCTRRNRLGDPSFMPLQEVLESYLRQIVGEIYWQTAKGYQRAYLLVRRYRSRLQQQQNPFPLTSTRIVHI
jgi:hypothetical protein